MCEKAARIAELEREIATLETEWDETEARLRDSGGMMGDPFESIEEELSQKRAELARLRNESPAITQGEGSEPVGWRDAAAICRAFARWNAEHIKDEDDMVFAPVANAANDCAELIEKYARTGNLDGTNLEGFTPLYASPPPLPAEPVGLDNALHIAKSDYERKRQVPIEAAKRRKDFEVNPHHYDERAQQTIRALLADIDNRREYTQVLIDAYAKRMSVTSPPSLPEANADPRVREALEALRKTQWPFQKVTCAGFKDDYVILRGDGITTGQLRAVSIATRNLAGAIAALLSLSSQPAGGK